MTLGGIEKLSLIHLFEDITIKRKSYKSSLPKTCHTFITYNVEQPPRKTSQKNNRILFLEASFC